MKPRTALLSTALMTVEEVATLLKPSPKSVYRWANDGLLPAVREGRLVMFLGCDVGAFVRDRMGVRTRGVD